MLRFPAHLSKGMICPSSADDHDAEVSGFQVLSGITDGQPRRLNGCPVCQRLFKAVLLRGKIRAVILALRADMDDEFFEKCLLLLFIALSRLIKWLPIIHLIMKRQVLYT